MEFQIISYEGDYYFNFAPGLPTQEEFKKRSVKLNRLTKGALAICKPFDLNNEDSKVKIELRTN